MLPLIPDSNLKFKSPYPALQQICQAALHIVQAKAIPIFIVDICRIVSLSKNVSYQKLVYQMRVCEIVESAKSILVVYF